MVICNISGRALATELSGFLKISKPTLTHISWLYFGSHLCVFGCLASINIFYFLGGKCLPCFIKGKFLSIFAVCTISHLGRIRAPIPYTSQSSQDLISIFLVSHIFIQGESLCSVYEEWLSKSPSQEEPRQHKSCQGALSRHLIVWTWQWSGSNCNYRIKLLVKHVL